MNKKVKQEKGKLTEQQRADNERNGARIIKLCQEIQDVFVNNKDGVTRLDVICALQLVLHNECESALSGMPKTPAPQRNQPEPKLNQKGVC